MTASAPVRPTREHLPEDPGTWLTTVLRPAGAMTDDGTDRFTAALDAVSACSGVVLVDLAAAGPLPRRARRAMAEADARLTAAGGALVVLGPDGAAPVPLPAPGG